MSAGAMSARATTASTVAILTLVIESSLKFRGYGAATVEATAPCGVYEL
jgi:hypothetical protein